MPPYLTGIEGPPPKRNVVRSSRAGGASAAAKLALRPLLFSKEKEGDRPKAHTHKEVLKTN